MGRMPMLQVLTAGTGSVPPGMYDRKTGKTPPVHLGEVGSWTAQKVTPICMPRTKASGIEPVPPGCTMYWMFGWT